MNPPPEDLPRCARCGAEVELLSGESRRDGDQVVVLCETCSSQQELDLGEAA